MALVQQLLLEPESKISRFIDQPRLREFLGYKGNRRQDMLTVWQVTMILITLELLLRAYEPLYSSATMNVSCDLVHMSGFSRTGAKPRLATCRKTESRGGARNGALLGTQGLAGKTKRS